MAGDERRSADPSFDLGEAWSAEAELRLRGSFRDDDRRDKIRLALDGGQDADDGVELVAYVDGRELVDACEVQPGGGRLADHSDAFTTRGVSLVEEPARCELRPDGTEQARRGGFDRHLELALAERIVDWDGSHKRGLDRHVGQGSGSDDAVETFELLLRVPRNAAQAFAGGPWSGDDLCCRERVEAADDLVPGGL